MNAGMPGPEPPASTSGAPIAASASVAPPVIAAGWYLDPQGRGQRFWDGSAWTEQVAPSGASIPPSTAALPASTPTGDWVGGVLLSLLVPLIGLIVGIVYVVKGGAKRDVGIMCLVLSCTWPLLVSFALLGGA
jgi:hypothetical protein